MHSLKKHIELRGWVSEKSTFFKELTPCSRTYELHDQGGKKSPQNQDKQTSHTVLQKLSSKPTCTPLTKGKTLSVVL